MYGTESHGDGCYSLIKLFRVPPPRRDPARITEGICTFFLAQIILNQSNDGFRVSALYWKPNFLNQTALSFSLALLR